jgi:hypothetical protein
LAAAALPSVLEGYRADMDEKDKRIGDLEKQVKAMSASQPGAGTGRQAGTEGQGESRIKVGMSPTEALKEFTKNIWE